MKSLSKIVSFVLFVVLLVTSIPINGFYQVYAEEGYTEISCIDDLALIRSNLSGNYILTADLDLTEATSEGGYLDQGYGWVPIDGFNGKFDGNGHYIKGLTIYGTPSVSLLCIGFFGRTYDAEIKNLSMLDVDIDVNISRDNCYIGGIVGYTEYGYNTIISKCIVSGNISTTSTRNNSVDIGGMVGYVHGETNISNCINEANINSGSGICGDGRYYNDVIINSCYNIGQCKYAIGEFGSSDYIYNCYYLNGSATKGCGDYNDRTGFIMPLSENAMQNANYFVGFDFNTTWEMDPYCTYKYPQLKSNRIVRVAGIDMVSKPSKTTYYQGEQLDLSGATLKITYEGSLAAPTTILLTEEYVDATSYNMSTVGNQNVNVSFGGKEVTFQIIVNPIDVTSVSLSSSSYTLEKGNSFTLTSSVAPENATDKTITYSSSNEAVAVINSNGVVTGVDKGTAEITATSSNGKIAVCTVNVVISADRVVLSKTSLELDKGQTDVLTAVVSPIDTTDTLTWLSSNPTIASVNNGVITALSPGETVITVSANQNATKQCTVKVFSLLDTFSIVGLNNVNYTGEPVTPEIEVTDGSNVLTKNVDYTVEFSNNTEVGTASVVVNGIGFYKGTIVGSFNINEVTYTVTFISQGKVVKKEKVVKGSSAHAPKVSRKGYQLKGWSQKFNNVTKDITTIAQWRKLPAISKTTISKLVGNNKTSKATITIKKLKGVSGYQIMYANNKNMKKYKMTTSSNGKKVIKKISSKDKQLFVKVRGYKKYSDGQIVYGKWSKIYTLKWKK